MAKNKNTNQYFSECNKVGGITYKMSKKMAEDLVDPKHHLTKAIVMSQNYLCGYVNEEFGLKEKCTRVDLV